MRLSVQKAHLKRSTGSVSPISQLASFHLVQCLKVSPLISNPINISKNMKTILSLIALAAISSSAFAGEACKKCCADKGKTCATCCKDAGKTCGKDCCKEK